MKPIGLKLKPHRQWDHLVTDGLIGERMFHYIRRKIAGPLVSFAGFALHNPRTMVLRAIHDRNTLCERLEGIVNPDIVGQIDIATPQYRKAVLNFLEEIKGMS